MNFKSRFSSEKTRHCSVVQYVRVKYIYSSKKIRIIHTYTQKTLNVKFYIKNSEIKSLFRSIDLIMTIKLLQHKCKKKYKAYDTKRQYKYYFQWAVATCDCDEFSRTFICKKAALESHRSYT